MTKKKQSIAKLCCAKRQPRLMVFTDDPDEPGRWDGDVVGASLLIFSNIALLPAIAILLYRRDYTNSLLFLITFFASMFYHTCRAGIVCFTSYKNHLLGDYIGVYVSIAWMLLSMPLFIVTSLRDARLHALLSIAVSAISIAAILVEVSTAILPVIGIGLPFFVMIVYIALANVLAAELEEEDTQKRKRVRRRLFGVGKWGWAILAIVLLVVAGVCMFFSPSSMYWLGHSLWHVFCMLGVLFLVLARQY